MKTLGIIGWRGMVGSVLLERMREEGDFEQVKTHFFSTSQAGQAGPDLGMGSSPLLDASDIDALRSMSIIISCQGGDYTKALHPKLRKSGWKGYWIDAASALRMDDTSVIVLDPINRNMIDAAIDDGVLDFIGGNCTVSLMLMAIGGLFQHELIEWVSAATYQAASGAGAKNMRELVAQMQSIGAVADPELMRSSASILALDQVITASLKSEGFPKTEFGAPLAASLLPWIDRAVEDGQTREEWKGSSETNKIIGSKTAIPIDGICVRIGAMRCHSQAFTIKLKQDIPLADIENILSQTSDWTQLIPNSKEATLSALTPTPVSGTLAIPIGRVRKMNLGPTFVSAFTVGDQLLWGAAEPLRRMLRILLNA
jgi:aspartate-semialdehyde dehydrogenase